ncbi:MAG: NADH-dependent [FeFe] hydrogenase, group A6 [Halanaerobiales bacterium]
MLNVTIDGLDLQVEEGTTILEAAREANIKIPTLCYEEELSIYGGCRLCVVEVEGEDLLKPACATEVQEGMKVKTHSPRVREVRQNLFELIIASHDISCELNCLTCSRSASCELREVAEDIGVSRIRLAPIDKGYKEDHSSHSIVREPNKCIACGRCERKCEEVQGIGIFTMANRGPETIVTTFEDKGMGNVECTNCGQCILACPTGALHEVYHMDKVWEALHDESKHVVVQTAPAVRVGVSEPFGDEPGAVATGQMVTALRRMGFDRVFDTNFTADLTIMEEGTEVVNRIVNGENIPVFTSCSPGWIKFIEHFYPEYLNHLSTAKSPQQMFGALAKSYYAEQEGIDPDDIVCVSIMPCTAKKFECQRPEMEGDVDYVLTTRELAAMIKSAGIDLLNLEEQHYDQLMGTSTGAAQIFGATGGVMEAAIRTAYEIITKEPLEEIDITAVRGAKGIKEAEIKVNDDLTLKAAVAHGLGNARKVMEMIKSGEKDYHFVEFMACPGGCIGGGGQPIHGDISQTEIIEKRIDGIYGIDKEMKLRKSHENPMIQKLYEEYLGEPNSHKAHELLHTEYTPRGI